MSLIPRNWLSSIVAIFVLAALSACDACEDPRRIPEPEVAPGQQQSAPAEQDDQDEQAAPPEQNSPD